MSTGARCEELVNVKVSDIDFISNKVILRVTKGDKPRIVFLTDVANMRIKEYLKNRKGESEYLFSANRYPHGKLKTNSIAWMFSKLSDKCGVDNIHPHRFRRTFATNAIRSGMPIVELSKLMGHSSIQTTMRYLDIDETDLKNTFDKYIH